jgi:hypothetical protein
MRSQVYLFYDRQRPAGVVRDWGELCQWTRWHGPVQGALQTLIDEGQNVPSAELEQDLIACFLKSHRVTECSRTVAGGGLAPAL